MQRKEFKPLAASCPTIAFWDRSVVIFKSIRKHGVVNVLYVNKRQQVMVEVLQGK
jgi:hypothetical protein